MTSFGLKPIYQSIQLILFNTALLYPSCVKNAKGICCISHALEKLSYEVPLLQSSFTCYWLYHQKLATNSLHLHFFICY